MKQSIIHFSIALSVMGCGNLDSNSKKDKEQQPASGNMPVVGAMPVGTGTSSARVNGIKNLKQLLEPIGLQDYHRLGITGQEVTVAILDNGYWGFTDALGTTLPPYVGIEQPATGSMAQTLHGTKMAEIVYSVATGRAKFDPNVKGPDLKLFITSGAYRNLEKAVNDLIEFKQSHPSRTVIALYAQIWEFGGNGDGEGFINALVKKALSAGVIWVNAVGNLGKSTYFAPVEKLDDNYLRLPYKERYLKFNVPEGNTPVKITLSWSDFSDSFYEYATNQDLDLILEEKNGKVLSDAGYIQDGKDHGTEYGYSRHAREKIDATLQKGEYRLKVKAKSKLDSQLHFWIAVSGPGVTVEGSNGRDKVLIPADNPEVLAIGAYDVDYCNMQLDAAGKKIFKPDMVTSSVIQFEDGMVVHGSSTASAIAAGTLAVYASSLPGRQVTRAQLLEQIASRKIVADTPELIGMFGTRFDPSKVILPPVLKLPKP